MTSIKTSGMILDEIQLDIAKTSLGIVERNLSLYNRRLVTGEGDYGYIPASAMHEAIKALKEERARLLKQIGEITARREYDKKLVEKIAKGGMGIA